MCDVRIERMNDHFTKLYLPDGRVVHRFSAADGPEADYHDHPFSADIRIIDGGYVEQILDLTSPGSPPVEIERRAGDVFHNEAGTVHRIIRLTAPETWTEFRPGPHERVPGFYRMDGNRLLRRLWHDPDFTPLEGD